MTDLGDTMCIYCDETIDPGCEFARMIGGDKVCKFCLDGMTLEELLALAGLKLEVMVG